MPNLAELNVVVGADVKALDAGLNEAKQSISTFANLASTLESLKPFDPVIVKAILAAKNVGQLTDALVQLKISQEGATDPKELLAYNDAIKIVDKQIKVLSYSEEQLNAEVTKLGKSLEKQSADAVSANKKIIASNAEILSSTSKLTAGLASLSKGFSYVRQAAYLLPGIGIAGIFNLAFEAIGGVVEKLGLFSSETKSAKIAVDEYTASMKKNYEAAGQQLARVSEIAAALESESVSIDRKKKLINDLNSISSTYFGNLKLEGDAVSGLAAAYELYAENIFKVAKAKAAEESIKNLSTQVVGLTDKINSLTNSLLGTNRELTLKDASRGINAIKNDLSSLKDIIKGDVLSFEDIAKIARLTGLDEIQINQVLAKRSQYRTKELQILGQISELSKLVAQNDLSSLGKGSQASNIKTISDVLAELQNKFALISSEQDIFGNSVDANKERIQALNAAINALINIKVPGDSAVVKGLLSQIDALNAAIDEAKLKLVDLSAARGGERAPGAVEATGGTATPNAGGLISDKWQKSFLDAYAKGKRTIDELGKELQQQLTNIFENLAVGIGEAIGSLFSGKASFLQTLGKVLGQGIKALGAELIKLGVEAAAVQKAIASLLSTPAGPVALIAGGIALEAIGSAVSNLGIQQHAEGGIFDKPTLIGSHLFGEKGPEVLLPLNRLNTMLGSMNKGSNVEVTGNISLGYDKLLVAIQRADRFTQRNYGNFNQ